MQTTTNWATASIYSHMSKWQINKCENENYFHFSQQQKTRKISLIHDAFVSVQCQRSRRQTHIERLGDLSDTPVVAIARVVDAEPQENHQIIDCNCMRVGGLIAPTKWKVLRFINFVRFMVFTSCAAVRCHRRLPFMVLLPCILNTNKLLNLHRGILVVRHTDPWRVVSRSMDVCVPLRAERLTIRKHEMT